MTVAEFLRPDGWLGKRAGPRYVQLSRRLEEGISLGIVEPDSPLPPERDIAEQTGLSRVTVRKAIQSLARKGKVVQRQGSGSFVCSTAGRVEQSLSRLTSFSDDMARRGMTPASTWLERGIFVPSPEEMVALGLSAGAAVTRIYRLREADGRAMALERCALPVDILPDPHAVKASLYDVLERSGNRPVRAIQKISAINLAEPEAKLLGVLPGDAGLSIQRTSYLISGRVAEFTRSVYRGDAYDFVAELRLANIEES